jgi:FKBP-type peptidyl-prolyl cis-trans isomerase
MRALIAFAAAVAFLTPPAPAGAGDLPPDGKKPLYAIGVMLSRQLAAFNLSDAELKIVEAGLHAGLAGSPRGAAPETLLPRIRELAESRKGTEAENEKRAGRELVEQALREPSARRLDSGVVYVEHVAGTGDAPAATDRVTVHYRGTRTDGSEVDDSRERGEPVSFPLDSVIPCWSDGVREMRTGGKAKLVCPSDVAYGDAGMPPTVKPGATLVFEIELLKIEKVAH